MLDGAGVVSRWVLCGFVCALGLGMGGLSGQRATGGADAYVPTMTFDVASVRESERNGQGWFRVGGGFRPADSSHLTLENNSLDNLLLIAYSTRDSQLHFNDIDGGDSFKAMGRAIFNVDAKAGADTDAKLAEMTKEQVRAEQRHMLQMLLADRFKLKVHRDDREKSTYDLVVAKRGRLVSTGEPPSADELKAFGDRPIPPLYQRGSSMSGFEYIAHGASMSDIAEMLTGQFGQEVNDRTGLTGKYDFHLKTFGVREDRKMDETNPWPPLENAVEDQLGLRLVRSKGMVRTLVVDHVELPSEN